MPNAIKDTIEDIKKVREQLTGLRANVDQLQHALGGVNNFVDEVNKAVATWQFKNRPRFMRMQKIIDRLNDNK